MSRTLYLDCISGISGDMLLAALFDLGADLQYVKSELEKLPVDEFDLWVDTVDKLGITAKKLGMRLPEVGEHEHSHGDGHTHSHTHEDGLLHGHSHAHEHRRAAMILEMIRESELPERVKARSGAVFDAIAVAEGKIHGIDPAEVHFHEVGAMDSILDIIGACLAMENLGVDEIHASPVPTGYGKVKMAHGLYPVPAPATAELLKGIPLAKSPAEGELTTPTGAGVLRALATRFGPLENFTVDAIGYGAGTKNFPEHPNVLRAMLGQAVGSECRETIHVLEAQVDDCTAETCGYVMERLFENGALDVYYTSVQMKKNRPGTLVSVLCASVDVSRLEEILLRETTTFGVRQSIWTRRALAREFETVETPYGSVRVKIGSLNGRVLQETPEYEDVARVARENGVPFREVYRAALHENKKTSLSQESR
ncbi:nickel pincer cofactor biosynthesis protein LarC [Tumebacillus sp. ITR2]|uniref:Pyridinium-3,5-bisthiocarboxylic acid mononucleotide nickel insertion protein n=1 Tax=Tumebacillus amylolyticus TaxID=2801339 RepID=A0ABS1JGU7_9BACL|nr:nickel pincer cofactor biosynthesis protein LarC [Tumebacillus amylolyticus]MBL0389493.1 nickel pincer cofactor biosynthesis protein LarC [Tumebacillus amylolyticus]